MPHNPNRMKLRGDIHPPEVEYDLSTRLDDDDSELQTATPRLDDIDLRLDEASETSLVVLAVPAATNTRGKAQQIAGRQLAHRPMIAILGAFGLGILLARMLKKGARAL